MSVEGTRLSTYWQPPNRYHVVVEVGDDQLPDGYDAVSKLHEVAPRLAAMVIQYFANAEIV